MRLALARSALGRTATFGALQVPGPPGSGPFCWTLERLPTEAKWPCIPAGTYELTVELCFNSRLWTPYPDRELPRLHAVPGRTGVLLHAGNTSKDTEGCIILGYEVSPTFPGESVGRSRAAVKALVDLLRSSARPHSLVVVDPAPVGPAPAPGVAHGGDSGLREGAG